MEDFDIGKWFRGVFGRLMMVITVVLGLLGISFIIGTFMGGGVLTFIMGVVCLGVTWILGGFGDN